MSGMTVADVMTHCAVSVTTDTPYRDLVDLVELQAVNAVPVADCLTARVNAIDGVVSVRNRAEWSFDDTVNAMPV